MLDALVVFSAGIEVVNQWRQALPHTRLGHSLISLRKSTCLEWKLPTLHLGPI